MPYDGMEEVEQSHNLCDGLLRTNIDTRKAGKEKNPKHCQVWVPWKPPDPGVYCKDQHRRRV
jgi:hypothetical protein